MVAIHQQLLFCAAAIPPAGIAAFYDLRERRIPNPLTGTSLLLGLALHLTLGGWAGLGNAAAAGLLCGALFFLLFLAGGMGAGDVKLMAAIGVILGFSDLAVFMISTVLLGAFAALAVSARHGKLRETLANVGGLLVHHSRAGLRPHPVLNLGNATTMRLPFAVPIAFGCLFTSVLTAWSMH